MIDIDAVDSALKANKEVRIKIGAMRPLLISTCTACVCATALVIFGNAGAQIVGAVTIVGSLIFFCGTYAMLATKNPSSLGVEIILAPHKSAAREEGATSSNP